MRVVVLILLLTAFLGGGARAEVPPVSITAPESEAWTGERVRVFVELRANGSFSGSASFDLPEIPGTLLIKVGNPVVGTKEMDGESWFVQTHEFALFSQKTGTVTIPPFAVRFGSRDGFTGPGKEVTVKTEALPVKIQRPPGSEGIPFLVTTEKLTVEETWDPVPGAATVGDVFRRTIIQKAEGLTGMALLPAPTVAPDGVRIYEPRVETSDNTQRGAFMGERRETLTYLLQEDGSITLPELTYTWWNPEKESLESKTLPAVAVQVVPVPFLVEPAAPGWFRANGVVLAVLVVGLVVFLRQRIATVFQKAWRILNPPERVAVRHLRRACHRNDPAAACESWNEWRSVVARDVHPDAELRTAVLAMNRALFGPVAECAWEGRALWYAFSKSRHAARSVGVLSSTSALPFLNYPNNNRWIS